MHSDAKHKICTNCKKEFPATLEFFHKHPSSKDGMQTECKVCRREKGLQYYYANIERYKTYQRKWRQENPEKYSQQREEYINKYKEYKLFWNFKITMEDYDMLYKAQNGVCAICGKPETWTQKGKIKQLSVDHDHETGVIRGLLCHRCNLAIGGFHDSPELLDRAIVYLETTNG